MPLQPLVMLVLLAAVLARALAHLVAEGDRLFGLTLRHHGRRGGGGSRHRWLDVLRGGGGLVAVGAGPLALLPVLLLVGRVLFPLAVLGRAGGGGEGEFVRDGILNGGRPTAAAFSAALALLFAAPQVLAWLRLRGGVGAPAPLAASLAARLWRVGEPETEIMGCRETQSGSKDFSLLTVILEYQKEMELKNVTKGRRAERPYTR